MIVHWSIIAYGKTRTCFRLNTKITKTLVDKVVTNGGSKLITYESYHPTVSMGRMFRVHLLNELHHRFPIKVTRRGITTLPFILTCTAYAHHGANIRYCKIS